MKKRGKKVATWQTEVSDEGVVLLWLNGVCYRLSSAQAAGLGHALRQAADTDEVGVVRHGGGVHGPGYVTRPGGQR